MERADDIRTLRIVVAGGAVAIVVIASFADTGAPWQVALASLGAAAIVAWASYPRIPTIAVALVVAACALGVALELRLEPALFLLSLAALLTGASEDSRSTSIAVAVLLAATPPLARLLQVSERDWSWGTWMIGASFPWVMGRLYRAQRVLVAELDLARRELADRAVVDERRRIARDLHDLVGHGLASVMLQVTSARHVLHRDIEAADDALRTAESVGRRSLQDVRRTVGLLRSDSSQGGAAAPLPSALDLRDLVADATSSGIDVSFESSGSLDALDGAVAVAIYRIVQESLANAIRYAPRATTAVRLCVEDGIARLQVDSVGPLEDGGGRNGYGLVGMHERASTLGGRLAAGPTANGWRVAGSFPLPKSTSDVQ